MSEGKRETRDLLTLIKASTKPILREEKEDGPDCSKWVARVNQGWDVAELITTTDRRIRALRDGVEKSR